MRHPHVARLSAVVPTVVLALFGCGNGAESQISGRGSRPPAPTEAASEMVSVDGVVRSDNGTPVAAALVAIIRDDADVATAIVATAADGTFVLSVAPGKYALSATAGSNGAAFRAVAEMSSDGEVELALVGEGEVYRGRVLDEAGAPWPDRRVRIQRASQLVGDVFYCETDANGNFAVRLPSATGYQFSVDVAGKVPVFENVAGKPTEVIRLAMPEIASDPVIEWIRETAVRLTTTQAGSGFADLRALKQSIGGARIVGLGEATHGSRQFRQIRRRMVEYLMTELGFTVLAVESSYAESILFDDYILGKGSSSRVPALLRARYGSLPETVETIEWMRRFNADPAHGNKLRFIGVDVQQTARPSRELAAYFDKVDGAYAKQVRRRTALFLDRAAVRAYWKANEATRRGVRADLDAIVLRLEEKRGAYVRASSKEAWRVARHLAQTLVQAEQVYAVMRGPNIAAFNARDRAMAENIKWILETQPRGARVVYWGHNGHVAGTHPLRKPQGAHLRTMFGDRYMSVATSFSEGSFRAVGRKGGRPTVSQSHTAEPALPGTVGATLRRTGHAILFVDLRRRPKNGPVADWFRKPHPIRSIGSVFMGERYSYEHVVLPDAWDALIFIRETSASAPPRAGRRD